MARPIRISSNRNESYLDGVPSFRILAPAESWSNTLSALYLDDFKGADSSGETFSDAALASALSLISNNGTIYLGTGTYLFKNEYILKKNIRIVGQGKNSTFIKYIPEVSNSIFLTFTGVNAQIEDLNEEGQLKGAGLSHLFLYSDRSIRANALKFVKVDKISIYDIEIQKFKGSSLSCHRCREWDIVGVQTRFNGYLDSTNPGNSIYDMEWESTDGTGDSTNYTRTLNLALIYSFSGLLKVKDSVKINITNIMFHVFPEGNIQEEQNVLSALPLYNGISSQSGFSSSGDALNEYAALHNSPGSLVSNVSGQTFKSSFKYFPKVRIDSSEIKLINGELIDGRSGVAFWADNNSEVFLTQFIIKSVSSSQYSSTYTFSNSLLTVSSVCPETGTPIEVSSTGTIPTGISEKTIYFIIKISDTTCRLASSYSNSIVGTSISISGGSGTHTLTSKTGYNLLVTNSSKVLIGLYSGLSLDDGYQAAYTDSSSIIKGSPNLGETFAQGAVVPQVGPHQVLFIGRNLNFALSSDQALKKVFGGRRYLIKEVVAICKSGGASGTCSGGIYTLAGKSGTQIIASTQSWLNLSATGKYVSATLPSIVTTDTFVSGETTSFPLYLSLTTGSSTTCYGDLFILGVIVD